MRRMIGLVICLVFGLPIFILWGIWESIVEWAGCVRKLADWGDG